VNYQALLWKWVQRLENEIFASQAKNLSKHFIGREMTTILNVAANKDVTASTFAE